MNRDFSNVSEKLNSRKLKQGKNTVDEDEKKKKTNVKTKVGKINVYPQNRQNARSMRDLGRSGRREGKNIGR